MTYAAIRLGRYRCDPAPARTYAAELRRLGKAVREAEGAYATGVGLDRRRFEGVAGDSFRAQCRTRTEAAAELSGNLASLSEAADELSLDAQELEVLLDEMVRLARGGGLVVAADAIHPPDTERRVEDTPALVQGWRAWEVVSRRHAEVETTYQRALDDWIQAIGRYGYSAWARDHVPQGPWVPDVRHEKGVDLPPDPWDQDQVQVQPSEHSAPTSPGGSTVPHEHEHGRRDGGGHFDEESRAWWVEGHRGWDGEWVHAHWKPLGPDGHLPVVLADRGPHVGEHPSGATTARWVDGRWQPVVPEARPPWIA